LKISKSGGQDGVSSDLISWPIMSSVSVIPLKSIVRPQNSSKAR